MHIAQNRALVLTLRHCDSFHGLSFRLDCHRRWHEADDSHSCHLRQDTSALQQWCDELCVECVVDAWMELTWQEVGEVTLSCPPSKGSPLAGSDTWPAKRPFPASPTTHGIIGIDITSKVTPLSINSVFLSQQKSCPACYLHQNASMPEFKSRTRGVADYLSKTNYMRGPALWLNREKIYLKKRFNNLVKDVSYIFKWKTVWYNSTDD